MIIYGVNPVREALRAVPPLPVRVYLEASRSGPRAHEIRQLALRQGVALTTVDNLDRLTDSREHQGCAADLGERPPLTLDDLPDSTTRVVMLDGLQDPHNFGAALRVCEVFGVPEVIFHHGNSCGITPAAIKASAGAYAHLRLYESNLNRACKRLKERGFALAILAADGTIPLPAWRPQGKVCLIMGSEGEGVRHALRRLGDLTLAIPMRGRVDSLNVSNALAVALYQLSLTPPPA